MKTHCFIALCIVFTMHVHKISAEDIPEIVPEGDINVASKRLDLDDMEYERDSDGDSRVPQILLPRGKEHEYVRLPNKEGEFEVVSRKTVEASRRNASMYDAARYTKFILYTRANNGTPITFKFNEIDQLPARYGFNPNVSTIILIHGWLGYSGSEVMHPTAKKLLETDDVNVIAVDWGQGSLTTYSIARYLVSKVAEYTAGMIDKLQDHHQKPEQIGIVGHSLGGHIAGLAGKYANTLIGYVIGLDPAAPLFRFNKPDERLSPESAQYVEVIHTNAKGLGFYPAIGQVDIYPNGGIIQPGCGLDLVCSHERCVFYFKEALAKQNQYAHRCADISELNENCSLGNTFLGGYQLTGLKTKPQGVYYMTTEAHAPFLRTLSTS